jgi:actin-like ATPase involved in cell morphogenesis
VTYVDLIAKGTIDVQVIAALKEKKSLADKITGDEWREWL